MNYLGKDTLRNVPTGPAIRSEVSPVEALLNQLGEALGELDSRVHGLTDKLSSVLSKADVEHGPEPANPAACQLEEVLNLHLNKLNQSNAALSALLRTIRL